MLRVTKRHKRIKDGNVERNMDLVKKVTVVVNMDGVVKPKSIIRLAKDVNRNLKNVIPLWYCK